MLKDEEVVENKEESTKVEEKEVTKYIQSSFLKVSNFRHQEQ